MSYRRAETNSFAEFQMSPGEGFGAAVTGNINSTEEVSKLALKGMKNLPAGLQGLNGYEGYPSHLSQYPNFAGEFGEETTEQISKIAVKNMDKKPAGLQGFEGFDEVQDDAFAGYKQALGDVSDNENDDEDDSAFDGYSFKGLEGTEESFHTFFHQASMASTDTELISLLAKAVKTVPADTPESVRKQYYDLAKEMLKRRKQTNLRHLDLQRAEIESNIGWLINPSLPKTGGFNAVLKKAIGTVGAKLATGRKDKIKADKDLSLGRQLQSELRKKNLLAGYGEFGSKLHYLGLGVAAILVVGIAYYLQTKSVVAPSRKNKRRKRA